MRPGVRAESEEIANGTYADTAGRGFIRIRAPRWRKVVVGSFRECPECGALVDGQAAKRKHQDHHDLISEIEEAQFGAQEEEDNPGGEESSSQDPPRGSARVGADPGRDGRPERVEQ